MGSKIQEYSKERKYVQELKSKKFSSEVKDDPNAVCFYTSFENYDAPVAVFKYLQPKASRMHFWQGIDKCKDGTLKYQNENINKPGRKRKLSFFKEFFVVLFRLKTSMFLLNLS